MPNGKCATGSGLQVFLEADGLFLSWEFKRHHYRPRSMRQRVSARTLVVPFESCAQIIRDPDIVSRWINVAAEDVNDAFLDAVHADR